MFKNNKENPSLSRTPSAPQEWPSEAPDQDAAQDSPVPAHGSPHGGNPTYIPFGTEFRGEIKTPGQVVLDGKIDGTVSASGNVQIGAKALCTGEIEGENVTVAGTVKGKVYAAVNVTLLTGSKIEGDVHAQALKIEDNVSFKGNCVMGQGARERHANDRFTLPPSIERAATS